MQNVIMQSYSYIENIACMSSAHSSISDQLTLPRSVLHVNLQCIHEYTVLYIYVSPSSCRHATHGACIIYKPCKVIYMYIVHERQIIIL